METYHEKDCLLLRGASRRESYRHFVRKYLLAQLDLMIVFINWQIDFVFATVAFVRSFVLSFNNYESEQLASAVDPYLNFVLSEKENSSDSGNSTEHLFSDCEEVKNFPDSLSPVNGSSTKYRTPTECFRGYTTASDTRAPKLTTFREVMQQRRNALGVIKSFSTPRQVSRSRFLEKSDLIMAPRVNRFADELRNSTTAVKRRPSVSSLLDTAFIQPNNPREYSRRNPRATTSEGARDLKAIVSKRGTVVTTSKRSTDLRTSAEKAGVPTTRSIKTVVEFKDNHLRVNNKELELDAVETSAEDLTIIAGRDSFSETSTEDLTMIQNENSVSETPAKSLEDQPKILKNGTDLGTSKSKPRVKTVSRIQNEIMDSTLEGSSKKETGADSTSIRRETSDVEELPRSNDLHIFEESANQVQAVTGKKRKDLERSPRKEKASSPVKKQIKVSCLVSPQNTTQSIALESGRVSGINKRRRETPPLTMQLRPRPPKTT